MHLHVHFAVKKSEKIFTRYPLYPLYPSESPRTPKFSCFDFSWIPTMSTYQNDRNWTAKKAALCILRFNFILEILQYCSTTILPPHTHSLPIEICMNYQHNFLKMIVSWREKLESGVQNGFQVFFSMIQQYKTWNTIKLTYHWKEYLKTVLDSTDSRFSRQDDYFHVSYVDSSCIFLPGELESGGGEVKLWYLENKIESQKIYRAFFFAVRLPSFDRSVVSQFIIQEKSKCEFPVFSDFRSI